MRRIVSLTAGITLALTVSAQTFNQLEVPRPQAPGIEYSIAKAQKGMKQTNGFKPLKDMKVSGAPKLLIAPAAPRLKESASNITTKDTLLVTEHKTLNSSNEEQVTESFTYDKYGRRDIHTLYNADGSVNEERKYNYEVGPLNYWTSRYIQIRNKYFKEWVDSAKEEREFDANLNVIRKKTYTHLWNQKHTLILVSDKKYDFSHIYKASDDEPERRGALVESYEYYDNGEQKSHIKYQWFEPAKVYILSYQEENGSELKKIETQFTDDSYTHTFYRWDSNIGWYKYHALTYFYENYKYIGWKEIYYNKDGSLSSYKSNKTTSSQDDPSAGWTTYINSRYDPTSDTFIPKYKLVIKGVETNEDGSVNDGYAYYQYNYVDGDWILYGFIVDEILDGKIYKTSITIGDDVTTEYKKLDENNHIIGNIEFNDDKSYQVIVNVDEDADLINEYTILYYYDANHNLLKTIKRITGLKNNINYGDYADDEYTYYELKDGIWEIVKEYDVDLGIDEDGFNTSRLYQFNDEGYPSVIIDYAQKDDINGGEKFVSFKTIYTYYENGYKIEEYCPISDDDLTLQLDDIFYYNLLADGSRELITLCYDDETLDGSKEVTDPEGNYSYYTWNTTTNVWELLYTREIPFQEYVYNELEDGTQVKIQRKKDENGKIVNVAKTETYSFSEGGKTEDREATYTWDETDKEWVGVEKSEKRSDEFVMGKISIDPISNYDDEYVPHDTYNYYWTVFSFEANKYYNWDVNAKDWKVYKKPGEENKDYTYQIGENKLSYTQSLGTDNCEESTVGEYNFNEDGYYSSSSYTSKVQRPDMNFERKTVTSYSYNKYGLLEEERTDDYYDDGTSGIAYYNKYVYADAQIIPTLIEQLPLSTTAKGISVDGLTIRHEGTILLYNAEGRLAARGNGFVIAPQAGLYVIKTEGQTVKMVLK